MSRGAPAKGTLLAAAVISGSLLLGGCSASQEQATSAEPSPVQEAAAIGTGHILWVSDLYEPVNDPDDHYDLAVSEAYENLAPDMIVLDDHLKRQDGQAPAVQDLTQLLGRKSPPVVLDHDTKAQAAWLRDQPDGSVTVVSLGALTAVADLIKSAPKLTQSKVHEIVVVAGDAAPGAAVEYNVYQDPEAFLAVMTSGLAIRWVPAFDGGLWSAGTSSYTVTSDDELLTGTSPEVRAWFDRYISERYGVRNLWAAGVLAKSLEGSHWEDQVVRFDDQGRVDKKGSNVAEVTTLVVDDRAQFEAAMIEATNEALRSLAPAGE